MHLQLKYPIFSFVKDDNMVYVFHRERDNKTTNTEIFKKYKFKGNIFIDSSGTKYIVKKAFMTQWRGFKGYFTGMQGRVIAIEYEYEDGITKVSLEELKEMILNRYPKSRWFSSAWVSVEELEQEMNKCNNFEELARLIGGPLPSSNIFLCLIHGY